MLTISMRRLARSLPCLAAALALIGCGSEPGLKPTIKELPALTKKLKDPDPQVRYLAADRIRYLKEQAEPALPDLLEMFEDENERCRDWSADAVGIIGNAAVPHLLKAIKSERAKTRASAWHAIAILSGEVKKANLATLVPALSVGIKDPDSQVRVKAAHAFSLFGNLAKEAVPLMLETIQTAEEKYVKCSIMNGFKAYLNEPELIRPGLAKFKEFSESPDLQLKELGRDMLAILGEKFEEPTEDKNQARPRVTGPPSKGGFKK